MSFPRNPYSHREYSLLTLPPSSFPSGSRRSCSMFRPAFLPASAGGNASAPYTGYPGRYPQSVPGQTGPPAFRRSISPVRNPGLRSSPTGGKQSSPAFRSTGKLHTMFSPFLIHRFRTIRRESGEKTFPFQRNRNQENKQKPYHRTHPPHLLPSSFGILIVPGRMMKKCSI